MILVTGGLGFLGGNLAHYLVGLGEQVLLSRHRQTQIPSLLEGAVQRRQVEIAPCDIMDLPNLLDLLKRRGVKSIIHAAAMYEGKASLYQVVQVNVVGTVHILEAARLLGLRRVTVVSSGTVYYGAAPYPTPHPTHEADPLPLASANYVAATKKAADILSLFYGQEYSQEVVITRPPRIYGPLYRSGRNPLQRMVEDALANRSTHLPQVREGDKSDLVYVKDCARGIGLVHLSPSLRHSVYNVGSGRVHSFAEVAAVIQQVIPTAKIQLASGSSPAAEGRLPLDLTRIREELGYTPEYDLQRGLAAYIEWLRSGNY